MLAFLQTNTPIVIFNQIVVTLLTVCFLYQVVFFVIGALRGEVAPPKAKKLHRYAFFIAAHNEEAVIANLVRSIKDQDYPSELIVSDGGASQSCRSGAFFARLLVLSDDAAVGVV